MHAQLTAERRKGCGGRDRVGDKIARARRQAVCPDFVGGVGGQREDGESGPRHVARAVAPVDFT